MTDRHIKVAEEIKRLIGRLLASEINDPLLPPLSVVTKVEMSTDLAYATIYLNSSGETGKKDNLLKVAERAKSFFRRRIAEEISLRYVPELRFKLDESIERGMEMIKLIEEVAAQDRKRAEARGELPPEREFEDEELDLLDFWAYKLPEYPEGFFLPLVPKKSFLTSRNTADFSNGVEEDLEGRKRVMLFPHINADPDAYGSCFALAKGLELLGCETLTVCEENYDESLNFMNPGLKIAVYGEDSRIIDEFRSGGYIAIQLDSHSSYRLGKRAELFSGAYYRIVLDHHRVGEEERERFIEKVPFLGRDESYYINPDKGSCCEMVTEFLYLFAEYLDRPYEHLISPEAANALLAGLYSDTGGLRYQNANISSYLCSAVLSCFGAKPSYVSNKLYEEISYESTLFRSKTLAQVRLDENADFAFCAIDPAEAREAKAKGSDYSEIVAAMRKIKGVKAAFMLREAQSAVDYMGEIPEGEVLFKLSIRSGDEFRALDLASALEGGGHERAAGGFVTAPDSEAALLKVLEKAKELL